MKRIFTAGLILFAAISGFSQKLEVGLLGGGMFYVGDLTEKFNSPVHPAGGIFLRINLNEVVSLRGNIILGSVSGADSLATEKERLTRNLSFQSKINEFSAILELNLVSDFNDKKDRRILVPYVFFGLNVFHFNPQAALFDSAAGKKILFELQPLGTEGQGLTKYPDLKRYNLNSYGLPIGLGFKFHFGDFWSAGLEFGMRKTLTDYLDDVSGYYVERDLISAQYGPNAGRLADRSYEVVPGYENSKGTLRGHPNTQDWYGVSDVWISYTFPKRSKTRCTNF
jgi:hypothetical protein